MTTALVELDDRFILPLSGAHVLRCCIGWGVTFLLRVDHGTYELRINGPFLLRVGSSEVRLVPEDDAQLLAPVLPLSRLEVLTAAALKDGSFDMEFSNGSAMSVMPDQRLEPWELSGPNGMLIVSTPGGELSVWEPVKE